MTMKSRRANPDPRRKDRSAQLAPWRGPAQRVVPASPALTLVEMLIVVVILGLAMVLALPSRASTARTQLRAALRIVQSDVYTMQSLARAAPPGDIYAMIMHYPDAPLVETWRPDIATALVQVSTGGCCVGGDCWDNQSQEYCLSEGGKYLGDDKSCLLYGKGNCTIADPPTAGQVDSALDFLPALTIEGTFDWPNASPAPAEPWPGTPGGTAFESPGSTDGNMDSFYSCGVIRNVDTVDEVFVELTRPDGQYSWDWLSQQSPPDAPLVETWRPDIATALVQVSTGGCCVGGDCWDNQSQEYCLSEGGKYLGDDKSCLLYGKGNCTIADPPTAGQVDSALDFLPALTIEGTFDWPNASPAPAEPWPGTPGGTAFESPGSTDGNMDSFYSCGVIRNVDTVDEVFVELTRPDGRPWNFNFEDQGLHLVTIAEGNSSDFYSQERALRFDHLGKPSRNVLFALQADKQSLAVAVSTSGELYWNIVTTNKGGKGKPDKKKPGKKGLGKANGGKKKSK